MMRDQVSTAIDTVEDIVQVILFLAVITLPAFVPEFFILLSLIIWPIYYLYIILLSIMFDSTQTLPWFFGDANTGSMIFSILILSCIGLINGIRGSVAMFLTYAPLLLLHSFMILTGIGVAQSWKDFKTENYIEHCADNFTNSGEWYCYYRVKNNKTLPCFREEKNLGESPKTLETFSCKQ